MVSSSNRTIRINKGENTGKGNSFKTIVTTSHLLQTQRCNESILFYEKWTELREYIVKSEGVDQLVHLEYCWVSMLGEVINDILSAVMF